MRHRWIMASVAGYICLLTLLSLGVACSEGEGEQSIEHIGLRPTLQATQTMRNTVEADKSKWFLNCDGDWVTIYKGKMVKFKNARFHYQVDTISDVDFLVNDHRFKGQVFLAPRRGQQLLRAFAGVNGGWSDFAVVSEQLSGIPVINYKGSYYYGTDNQTPYNARYANCNGILGNNKAAVQFSGLTSEGKLAQAKTWIEQTFIPTIFSTSCNSYGGYDYMAVQYAPPYNILSVATVRKEAEEESSEESPRSPASFAVKVTEYMDESLPGNVLWQGKFTLEARAFIQYLYSDPAGIAVEQQPQSGNKLFDLVIQFHEHGQFRVTRRSAAGVRLNLSTFCAIDCDTLSNTEPPKCSQQGQRKQDIWDSGLEQRHAR